MNTTPNPGSGTLPPRGETRSGAKLWLPAALFAAALLSSLPLRAAKYYVEPVRSEGDAGDLPTTVRDLITNAVAESGNGLATRSDRADYLLQAQLLRLGGAWLLTMQKWSAGAGTPALVYSEKLKSGTTEDLDDVTDGLTRDVIAGAASAEEPQEPEDAKPVPNAGAPVRGADGEIPLRNEFSVGFGPYFFQNMALPASTANATYSLNVGNQWPIEPDIAIDSNVDYAWTGAAEMFSWRIGGLYYLGRGAIAPFVGADMGYGSASTALTTDQNGYPYGFTSSVFGYSVGAQAGVLFFRDAPVNVALEMRYIVIFTNNDVGYPSSLGLALDLCR